MGKCLGRRENKKKGQSFVANIAQKSCSECVAMAHLWRCKILLSCVHGRLKKDNVTSILEVQFCIQSMEVGDPPLPTSYSNDHIYKDPEQRNNDNKKISMLGLRTDEQSSQGNDMRGNILEMRHLQFSPLWMYCIFAYQIPRHFKKVS